MKKIIIISFLLSVLFACGDDDAVITFFELSCLGDAAPSSNQFDCDNIPTYLEICEAEFVGDFSLAEESRSFIQQFCRNIGDVETYVNSNGEKMELTVSSKSFIQSHSVRNTFISCENDSTKFKGACFNFELGMVNLVSEPDSLKLIIQLKTALSKDDYSGEKIGDMVEILRRNGPNAYVVDFSVVVNERSIGYGRTDFQENLGAVELLGQTHNDVISSSAHLNFPNTGAFKYYYNKWNGLVAFEDSDGMLWRIDD